MFSILRLFGIRRVTSAPSEFLVHIRRGALVERNCRQGGSCLVFPGDSVAIVPTTLRTIRFEVSQVSRENAEVRVVGLAVYRIANPLITHRMVDFRDPDLAAREIERMLVDMCVAAVRRLVATMTLDDCLRKRKELLAEELQREIVPIVSGSGSPADSTEQGWGIVLDAIDIQDVHITSDEIFGQMQAPFRNELRSHDSVSRLAMESRVEEEKRRSEARRLKAHLVQEEETLRLRLEQRKKISELEKDSQTEEVHAARDIARTRTLSRVEESAEEHRARERIARSELEMESALAEIETRKVEIRRKVAQARAEEEAQGAEAEMRATRERRLREEEIAGEIERARLARRRQEVELVLFEEGERARIRGEVGPGALREIMLTRTMPEVARSFARQIGRVQVTQIQDGTAARGPASPLISLAASLGAFVRAFEGALPGDTPASDPGEREDAV